MDGEVGDGEAVGEIVSYRGVPSGVGWFSKLRFELLGLVLLSRSHAPARGNEKKPTDVQE